VTGSAAAEEPAPPAVLADLLAVVPAGAGVFTARVPGTDGQRPFGGHLIGLALRAAAATLDGPVAPAPHALHARFVRAGRPLEPVRIEVAPVHDGRSIAVRRVTVVQDSRTLLSSEFSFHAPEAGEDWQAEQPVLEVPAVAVSSPLNGATPLADFEIRAEHEHVRGAAARLHPYWARHAGALPDDPVLHACALAILTDIGVTGSARRPGSPLRVQRAGVTLDQTLWLHRPFRADAWLRVAVAPVTNYGGRGLARGEVHTAGGTLAASFVQEALLREPGPGAATGATTEGPRP
jgi:acyl-CoA thioesterase II